MRWDFSPGKKKSGGLRLRSVVVCRNSASERLQILLGLPNFARLHHAPPRGTGHGPTTSVFLYRRVRRSFRVYLEESRIPLESPLWYDR